MFVSKGNYCLKFFPLFRTSFANDAPKTDEDDIWG